MSITNPQQANEALQESHLSAERQRAAQQEHATTRAELERRRDARKADETVTIRIEGAPVEFRPAPVTVEERALELTEETEAFDVEDADELEGLSIKRELVELLMTSLPEHAEDPELPREFFEGYQAVELRGFFEKWVEASNSSDRVRSFRGQ